MSSKSPIESLRRPAAKVFIATTAMLTFISFWRAAAIVLSDLASSAFYVGGIAEGAIGKSAPWFILAVMLFSYAVRALYIESSTMFVRGGVYRVVREALGSTLAKVAVSALMFDFLLTGPISAVSAGQYMAGFTQDLSNRLGHPVHLAANSMAANSFAAIFAIAITGYFWWKNVQGIHETSEKALRIMQITTVMVIMMIGWSLLTIAHIGIHLPPAPIRQNMHYGPAALGWLGPGITRFAIIAALIGFGHSILAMSGEETLAQVYREIESPKVKNLEKAGLVIFLYSLLFTSLASFFAVMIIPDSVRGQYLNNLIGGLAMFLTGPYELRLVFQGFVVFVGALILAGAVNTAIIGSNGVLNRVSEDGVLTDWFRRPHSHFGTTYRIVNLICLLQIAIIVLTWGNVDELGEGYAFGLIWSFTFLAIAVLVLRFKEPEGREWKVPLNFSIFGRELPLGLCLIAIVLGSVAIMNLFTKEVATIAGLIFTAGFFTTFIISEHITKRERARGAHLDKFRIAGSADVAADSLGVRPGNVLVTVRDPNSLHHLEYTLANTDSVKQDIVVMTVRLFRSFAGPAVSDDKRAFDQYEQELFSKVVAAAEKAGKPVSLLVVPGANAYHTIVATAQRLESSTIVEGTSVQRSVVEQSKMTGDAWEELAEPRPRLDLKILGPDNSVAIFHLGPHTPRLRPEDLDLIHNLWLEVTADPEYRGLHHYDVVALALKELQSELHSQRRRELMETLRQLAHLPRYQPPEPEHLPGRE